ncbi:MAG: PAS domain S-box protein, partial [Desulfobacterales bacterium]|nr:PAS domain S-box protein [Desulfobacterales bacterium]
MKKLEKVSEISSNSIPGEESAPGKTPDREKIRRCAEELASVLRDIDREGGGLDMGHGADGSRPIRRLFDAVSHLHMNLAGLFKEPDRVERINKTLFKISNAVNTTLNLGELYESIHHALADVIDTTNFFIALYDKEEDMLSFPYFVDESTDIPYHIRENVHAIKSKSFTSRVIVSGKPFLIKMNDRSGSATKKGLKPVGALPRVWLGAPLIIKNEVIGAMVVQSYTDPDLYSEEDADILLSVSEQVAIAIDRKRAEEALQVEKAHIERLFEGVQEGIVVNDPNAVILNVNSEFTRLFGYSRDEARGCSLDDLIVPPEDMEEALGYNRRIALGETVTFEARRKRKDGAPLHVSVIAAPISLERGKIGQYTIYRDISERIRANNILLALYNISRAVNSTKSLDELFKLIHASLDAILDTTNFFIALYDEKTDILFLPYIVNEKETITRVVDVSKKTSLTMKVINANKALFLKGETITRMAESGEKIIGTISKAWVGVPLSIKGAVMGAVVVQSYTDPKLYSEKDIAPLESVSEQIAIAIDSKRTEEALSESEKMYKTLFDNAGDAIFVHEMGRGFLDVNAVACKRYGYSREEFLKMTPADLLGPEKRGQAAKRDKAIRRLGQVMNETEHVRRDGATLHAELNSRLIEYKGRPAVLSVARDLADRKRAEEEKRRMEGQLQNARKMEAIGMLAGGVAHDLNNILSGLVSYPELLLLDLPGESPMRDGILLIQKSGNRAAAIVQDLLTLARRGVVVSEVVDLNRIIMEHLESPECKSLRNLHSRVRVETDLEPDLFKI